MKKDLRIVSENGSYCITEVHYNKDGNPVKMLNDECGILAYWESVKELKNSFKLAEMAFKKPILKRL